MSSETVTTNEAAKICRVKPGTIREWHHRGKIHPVDTAKNGRPGRPVRLWIKAEVETLAAKRDAGIERLNTGDQATIAALEERIIILRARIRRRKTQP